MKKLVLEIRDDPNSHTCSSCFTKAIGCLFYETNNLWVIKLLQMGPQLRVEHKLSFHSFSWSACYGCGYDYTTSLYHFSLLLYSSSVYFPFFLIAKRKIVARDCSIEKRMLFSTISPKLHSDTNATPLLTASVRALVCFYILET